VSTGSFTFTSTDASATFECRVDGAGYAPCTNPFATGALTDGTHAFDVRSKDPAGNVSTPATYTWIIDTAPPVDAGGDAEADAETDGGVDAEADAADAADVAVPDAEAAAPDAPAEAARPDAAPFDGGILDGAPKDAALDVADAADAARKDAGRDAAPETGADATAPAEEIETANGVVVLGGGVCSYGAPGRGTGGLGLLLGALALAALRRRERSSETGCSRG
jgi:hypothetical protein